MHYNTLEAKDQRVHQSTQGQLLSDDYTDIGVCVLRKERHVVIWLRRGYKLQSLIKTTSSGQIQSDENGTIGPLLIIFSKT